MDKFWGTCLKGDIVTIACAIPLFELIVRSAIIFSGSVALIMIIFGGIKLILSGGEAKEAASARQIITYALIGLVIVLISFTVVNFISYITNASCLTIFGFDTCPVS